jgi:hypothetical protein
MANPDERSPCMSKALTSDDYLELRKYFTGRAEDTKTAMFQTVTRIVGFAAGAFALMISTLTSDEARGIVVRLERVMTSSSLTGILLCSYALLVIHESAKHIKRNWARTEYCVSHIGGLETVIQASTFDRSTNTIKDKGAQAGAKK